MHLSTLVSDDHNVCQMTSANSKTKKKVGIMHYNDLVYLTDTEPTYKRKFQDNSINLLDYECYCCTQPGAGTSFIGEHVSQYNQVLDSIAKEMSGTLISDLVAPIMGKLLKNIAVVYQPMNTLISTVPYNALRFVHLNFVLVVYILTLMYLCT